MMRDDNGRAGVRLGKGVLDPGPVLDVQRGRRRRPERRRRAKPVTGLDAR